MGNEDLNKKIGDLCDNINSLGKNVNENFDVFGEKIKELMETVYVNQYMLEVVMSKSGINAKDFYNLQEEARKKYKEYIKDHAEFRKSWDLGPQT